MKKYITLFTFLCVLFLGMQTATAQQSSDLKAKNKTISLEKPLELTTPQMKEVYKIFQVAYKQSEGYLSVDALHIAMKKINNILSPAQQAEMTKIFTIEIEKQKKIESLNRG